nr:PREDICTED: protein phosphatase 1 regulatory subunit 14B [Bos indicus]
MAVYANIDPVHVSVSAKTPLVPPLAEGRRTQKGGEWRSQVSSSDLCPTSELLICFLPRSSCRCLLGKEGWLPSAVGQGPQPEPLSHPLSQLRPLSLLPPPPLPQEEEIPELEIDVDELLDMESDDTRAARVKELLVDCYKPTEAFISGLLDKIRGMQKLSTPQKK